MRLAEYKQEVNVSSMLEPLHMSPVTGTNFPLGSNEKFQPGFRDEPKIKDPRDELWHEIRDTKPTWGNKNYNFRAYHSFGHS